MKNPRLFALLSLAALLATLAGTVQVYPASHGQLLPPAEDTTALVYVPLPSHAALAQYAATGLPAYARLPGKGLLLGAGTAEQAILSQAGLAFRVLDPDITPLLEGRSQERIYVAYPLVAPPIPDWAESVPADGVPISQPNWSAYGQVLLDAGSVVVLRLDPVGAAGLAQAGVDAQPIALVPRQLGSGTEGTLPAVITPDPLVQAMMDQIVTGTLRQYDGDLSGEWPALIGGEPFTITTRNTSSGLPIRKATEYVGEHLENLGLDVEYQAWSTITNPNVIGEIPGLVHPERIWIISAHLDDTSQTPYQYAPGADDNASGSVGVLAAADILSQYRWGCTLRFALFTGEEQGLLGSKAYAHRARLRGEDIAGVINMDMIAWNTPGSDPGIDIHAKATLTPTLVLAEVYSDVIATYNLDLIPEIYASGMGGSDHAQFWIHNYPAILAIEDGGDFNPYYHTTDDQLEYLDLPYFADLTRASLGTLVHLSGCLITGGVGMADGHVTAAVGGAPIVSATVTFEDSFRNQMPATTDAAGYYTRTLPVGTYTATAWAYGYVPQTASVTIYSGTTTPQDFQLALSPVYVVSGTVSDASTGVPLYARLSLPGMPVPPRWCDPATGFYSLTLPVGVYTLHVTATAHLPLDQVVAVAGDTTQDLALEPYACVLLVDDDQNSPNVEMYYIEALDALGIDYDYANTDSGEPTPYDLTGHRIVIWATGKLNTDMLSAYNEQVLAGYLDSGGRFLLTSQDYLSSHVTSFAQDYLGVTTAGTALNQTVLTGNTGNPIGDGLGPYTLTLIPGWSSSAYRPDFVNGRQAAPFRYVNSGQNNSSNYQGSGFRSVFFGWPPELIPDSGDRADVLGAVVDWLGRCGPTGLLFGTATDAGSGAPLEAVTVTVEPGGFQALTDPAGSYSLSLVSGPYTLTAEKDGYYSQTIGVTITAGQTTTQDLALEPIPTCEPVTATDLIWDPLTPAAGEVVAFTGSATGSLPITFTWDLGDGAAAMGVTATHAYIQPGIYTVTLTAQNCATATATAARVVTVLAPCEPVTGTAFTWLPVTPTAGLAVTFTASASGTLPITYNWDLGDGAAGTGQTIRHAYAAAGTYTVALTTTNCGGAIDVYSATVTVGVPPMEEYRIYLPLVVK
jgi:PKD repeat protein